ncbi:MAG TPA: response regulator transcription factor [bacterium]|nr:response regulator transcription factor [bacterium]
MSKKAATISGNSRESGPGRKTGRLAAARFTNIKVPERDVRQERDHRPEPDAGVEVERKIRVLVVDHEALLRLGVRAVAQNAPDIDIVGEAATGEEAVGRAAEFSPDVLLIEAHLPDGGGLPAIRSIRERCPNVRTLVLSERGDHVSFSQAAAAGAIGYILKDVTADNLLNAIRAAYHSQTFLSPTVAHQMLQQVSGRASSENAGGTQSAWQDATKLNRHDIEVLNRVAHGLSDKEIAAQLFLSESAVKSRLRHIYHRLGLKNRAQAVVFALERGFLTSSSRRSDAGASLTPVSNGAPKVLVQLESREA